ncbi:MAG: hypothetical protein NZ703_12805, partial [Gemmataceae bacterium]|nr:hypothetical protein [Gemmataceae bacterium]
ESTPPLPVVTLQQVAVIEMPAEEPATPSPGVPDGSANQSVATGSDSSVEHAAPLSSGHGPDQVMEGPVEAEVPPAGSCVPVTPQLLVDLWDQEQRTARRQLEPEGALTGASRELQAALGKFLLVCWEHGVKVGPWRLQHVVPEYVFSDHPTYGVVSLGYWACKDGQPWKVAVGLFLARGAGKPRELEVKFTLFDQQPAPVDLLVLLRPEDDLSLTGRSKKLWSEAEQRGRLARLEPVSLDTLAQLYAFPRFLAALRESLSEGAPLPNLADLIQSRCDTLLTQVSMPVHSAM